MSSFVAAVPTISARRGRGRPKGGLAPDRGALLAAALVNFSEHGFAGANVRAIADAAGVNVALISRYYGSKLGLWKAAVDHVSSRMRLAYASPPPSKDDRPIAIRLGEAIDRFVRFSVDAPELGRFFSDEVARPGERCDYVLDHIWKLHRDTMLPLLSEGKAARLVPPSADPELLLVMLIGAVSMPLMIRPVIDMELGQQGAADGDEAVRLLTRNVSALFLKPIGGGAG
jgi:AcrR family transcriptional regulator